MKLERDFFLESPQIVARKLLGKELVRKINGELIVCRIVETEAYGGINDKGSHAYGNKRTKRTEPMFRIGGTTYIYLIYGMYYLLNIVTGKVGDPNAVLVRAVEPVQGIDVIKANRQLKKDKLVSLTNGPGKLTQGLEIDMSFNEKDLVTNDKLYLRDSPFTVDAKDIVKAKRIHIDYSEEYKDKLWRYYIKNNQFVSK